ncbi:MAG TPA: plastocyanin/azurin family copper-binding protein [Ktedonobacterales bacterium]|nr:plastocyanin/azurin family copper-binding protein [Ktedonobacterales bacterium]
MKKVLTIPSIMALALAFMLAGCGKTTPTTTGGGNTVTMASVNFATTSLTVKAGDSVKFDDPSGGGAYHVLCFGKDEKCAANADGPAELNASGGVIFNAGDSHSYTFAKAGTYEVTCTVHPNMNVTITVQ